MPDLSQEIVEDLAGRLRNHLSKKDGYGEIEFLNAGGSAAVYKVETPYGVRAYKVFDPKFVNDDDNSKEKQRLELQKRLINHGCEQLVQTYSIEMAEGTAFVEMEFVAWPQLKKILKDVPDESVIPLIKQLTQAVRFLEDLNIVHRDIKPENIHVSPDWTCLKLLDLGVVREFDPGPDAAETDQGNLRPFLATAQYSSPEYLFRLDEPSAALWHALNFYQVGAVLHDLVMKESIFQSEIEAGNRWLVAKAVLTQMPSFTDGNPARLAHLKALARKCLTKDISTRLNIVDWSAFDLLDSNETLLTLRRRLESRRALGDDEATRRLRFDREQFRDVLIAKVREQLISTCQTDLPIRFYSAAPGERESSDFLLTPAIGVVIGIRLMMDWQTGVYLKTANIKMSAGIFAVDEHVDFDALHQSLVCCVSIDNHPDECAAELCMAIAGLIGCALDIVDSVAHDQGQLLLLNKKDLLI
ncbi:TPA: serine/threonine protein kinase [Pseudomonas aeruginosa]|nr:serine/threonine protein kinase [Pseudomonas aeruginosa]